MKVNPSPATLARFRSHLTDSGLAGDTADAYIARIRRAAASGVVARLTSELAPNTLHTERAALRSYAAFTDDGQLLAQVQKIRLPPARRVTPKVEIERSAWASLVAAIRADARVRPAVRATLLVMALRGLRVGDVLRLQKTEIKTALRTKRLVFLAKGRRRLDYAIGNIDAELAQLLEQPGTWATVAQLVAPAAGSAHASARRTCLRELKRIAGTIELEDIYNHRLRRTYATHFLRQMKGDPQAIMKLQSHMGWASPTTAMGYVDAVNTDELDQLAEELVADLRAPTPPAPRRPRQR